MIVLQKIINTVMDFMILVIKLLSLYNKYVTNSFCY